MTTLEVNWRITIILHSFEANKAVFLLYEHFTLMTSLKVLFIKTESASIAVKEVLSGALSADVALFTMIQKTSLPSLFVEGANIAEVLSKVSMTFRTGAALRLLRQAPQAFDARHIKTIHVVVLRGVELILVPNLIVAEPACIECSLADGVWTLELDGALVMFATWMSQC